MHGARVEHEVCAAVHRDADVGVRDPEPVPYDQFDQENQLNLNPLGNILAALGGLFPSQTFASVPQFRGATAPRAKKGWKSRCGIARPLRGYAARYTNVLSRHIQRRQLQAIIQDYPNGASRFQIALLKELSR
jgi:hypothetical protein